MVRIDGVSIPLNKRGEIALTYLYGIGPSTARYILDKLNISREKKVYQWTKSEISAINSVIQNELKTRNPVTSPKVIIHGKQVPAGFIRRKIPLPKRAKNLLAERAAIVRVAMAGKALAAAQPQQATARMAKPKAITTWPETHPTPEVYLGGKQNLTIKTPLETEKDYIHLIRKGVRKSSLDCLMEAADISLKDMADIMQVTGKELASKKPNELLEKDQAEKAVNIARLYALGEESFGSADEFQKWMNSRIKSLGNQRPKDFLDTSSGISLLMDEIIRIQHGVYS